MTSVAAHRASHSHKGLFSLCLNKASDCSALCGHLNMRSSGQPDTYLVLFLILTKTMLNKAPIVYPEILMQISESEIPLHIKIFVCDYPYTRVSYCTESHSMTYVILQLRTIICMLTQFGRRLRNILYSTFVQVYSIPRILH